MKIRMSFKQMVGWLTLSWATAASSGTFVVDDFTAFPTTISFTNAAVVGDILTHTDAQRTITSELMVIKSSKGPFPSLPHWRPMTALLPIRVIWDLSFPRAWQVSRPFPES